MATPSRKSGTKVLRRPSTSKTLIRVGGNSLEIHKTAVTYITVNAVIVRGEHTKIPITFTVDVLSQSSLPALLGLKVDGTHPGED
eukprot:5271907-Amphidinium_carterae.3